MRKITLFQFAISLLFLSTASVAVIPAPTFTEGSDLFQKGNRFDLSKVSQIEFWSGYSLKPEGQPEFHCAVIEQRGSNRQFQIFPCVYDGEYDFKPVSILAHQVSRAGARTFLVPSHQMFPDWGPSFPEAGKSISARISTFGGEPVVILLYSTQSQTDAYQVFQRRPRPPVSTVAVVPPPSVAVPVAPIPVAVPPPAPVVAPVLPVPPPAPVAPPAPKTSFEDL